MNQQTYESTKTVGFVIVAAAIVVIVCLTIPALPSLQPEEMLGKLLFPDFDDPLAAASLEIVEFDKETATARPFTVAQVNQKWSIPSHSDYPADAKDQLAEAASAMMGLKVLSVVSNDRSSHKTYGVIDPASKAAKTAPAEVGTRVAMKDAAGKTLLSLVIGKKVPGKDDLRYVRPVGKDSVYEVAVKTDKLVTDFSTWIEKDLLKLKTWDVKQIRIQDYSVDETRGTINQRGDVTIAYDDTGDPKWKLLADRVLKKQGDKFDWVSVPLAEDEELNTKNLDDMKSALDDLKIVDVARKPAGLSGGLKAAEAFLNNREAILSLAGRGYYVANMGGRPSLFSNEGETRVLMKDGVQYVLRFGAIALDSAKGTNKKDGESDDSGLNRYLFVMAEFNPEAIPKPELEPLPKEEKTPAPKAKTGEEKTKPKQPADTPPPETDKPKTDKPEPDEPKSDKVKADEVKAEKKPDIEAQRERIEKGNKRKQEEYDEKIEAGKKHVKELNARFADWYYVISDKVYRKIHLGRDQIIEKKEKKDAKGDGHGNRTEHDNAKKPKEPANPLEQFDKLKQADPAGNK